MEQALPGIAPAVSRQPLDYASAMGSMLTPASVMAMAPARALLAAAQEISRPVAAREAPSHREHLTSGVG